MNLWNQLYEKHEESWWFYVPILKDNPHMFRLQIERIYAELQWPVYMNILQQLVKSNNKKLLDFEYDEQNEHDEVNEEPCLTKEDHYTFVLFEALNQENIVIQKWCWNRLNLEYIRKRGFYVQGLRIGISLNRPDLLLSFMNLMERKSKDLHFPCYKSELKNLVLWDEDFHTDVFVRHFRQMVNDLPLFRYLQQCHHLDYKNEVADLLHQQQIESTNSKGVFALCSLVLEPFLPDDVRKYVLRPYIEF